MFSLIIDFHQELSFIVKRVHGLYQLDNYRTRGSLTSSGEFRISVHKSWITNDRLTLLVLSSGTKFSKQSFYERNRLPTMQWNVSHPSVGAPWLCPPHNSRISWHKKDFRQGISRAPHIYPDIITDSWCHQLADPPVIPESPLIPITLLHPLKPFYHYPVEHETNAIRAK